MARHHYQALTWDHPRGYNALAAAAAALPPDGDLALQWARQPLEGFESHPIADLCARYDIVVLDHPHVGEAVAAQCLQPLDELFPAEALDAMQAGSIGASLASYRYEGHLWALPLDAATQVAAWREALLDGPVPHDWDGVLALSSAGKVALSLAGPHALLSFGSICVALGARPGTGDPAEYVAREVGLRALDILATLAGRAPPDSLARNPIALLQSMADTEEVAYCPLVYGYVNYARPGKPGQQVVRFANAPAGPGGIGSTLGGRAWPSAAGLQVSPALLAHLNWLLAAPAQLNFIPDHDGQPSLRAAWMDPRVNARWGNFYRDTAATLEAAWVRPRFDGYIAFQGLGAELLRAGLADGRRHEALLAELNQLYGAHRPAGAAL